MAAPSYDGGVEGFRFSTDLRVRFSETDAQGIVHNAAYLVWLEIARIDYLARFAGGYKGLVQEHGIDVTTVEAYVRYRQPTRFDDQLRVWARTSDLRGARFRFEYAIERTTEEPGIVADGWTAHACVDAHTLRPRRLPEWLVETLQGLES
jgi:acyl-CoA thioester hydrolase